MGADIAPTLSTILAQKHSSKPISGSTAISNKLDSFLKEAYEINANISSLLSYLRTIRQPYLSTAPPPRRLLPSSPTHLTDHDRENIDSSTSQLLRDINANISNLDKAIKIRAKTDAAVLEKKYGKPSGFLWKWAAGEGDTPDAGKPEEQVEEEGRVKTMNAFREGVLFYLSYQLAQVATRQQQMVEIRLEREQEKERSVLYKAKTAKFDIENFSPSSAEYRGTTTFPNPNEASSVEAELSPEQIQLFEQENSTLLNHYNDTLTKVTQAEKSLLEISSLQQTLIGHLTVQGEMVEQLVADVANTDENLRRGNKELKKASERGSTAKGVFWGTVGLCSFLVVWDLIF